MFQILVIKYVCDNFNYKASVKLNKLIHIKSFGNYIITSLFMYVCVCLFYNAATLYFCRHFFGTTIGGQWLLVLLIYKLVAVEAVKIRDTRRVYSINFNYNYNINSILYLQFELMMLFSVCSISSLQVFCLFLICFCKMSIICSAQHNGVANITYSATKKIFNWSALAFGRAINWLRLSDAELKFCGRNRTEAWSVKSNV